jgi:thiol-disulfide isomerase/thioredoxin
MDRPEWVHRLMRTLMEGHLGVMDQFEGAGVLTLNNVNKMACDDLPQPDFDGEHVRLRDQWGRGESQEFQGVSPAQYEEFLLQYQKPILERYGLTFYGCCEDLTNKIDMVLSIPNLRKFVCSAWTDIGKLAEATGDRYCIEWRQGATDVVYAPDLSDVPAATVVPAEGDHAADFTVMTLDGAGFTLSKHQEEDGRPVFLNMWASWCPPCRAEMPDINAASQNHTDIKFIGVSVNDDPSDSVGFATSVGITYTIGFDVNGDVAYAYDIVGLPASFIISPDGVILQRVFGAVSEADIDAMLDHWFS